MSSSVIKIENLYKEYRLGTIGYGTLREDLESWWAKIRGRPDPNSIIGQYNEKPIGPTDHILALNNINLEVKQGERLGIIGKNGAGKTTLLKILSRIASPTKGSARIKGRVASLIAVGTGFHHELTGRENIYLNGSIFGLRKFEIDQRFDEIVNFSGIEQFIDTPVKRLSSGMYIRLGFAVAAHLDPDVLIVDEVLAVGDAEFQKKALGKMKNVSNNEGRTILFVSHNMKSISNLCNEVVLLNNGQIDNIGKPQEIIRSYLEKDHNKKSFFTEINMSKISQDGNGSVTIQKIGLMGQHSAKYIFDVSERIIVQTDYYNHVNGNRLCVYVLVQNENEEILFASGNLDSLSIANDEWFNKPYPDGLYQTCCIIPGNFLNAGNYFISVNVQHDVNQHAALSGPVLKIKITDELGSISELNQDWPGYMRKKIHWETKPLLYNKKSSN